MKFRKINPTPVFQEDKNTAEPADVKTAPPVDKRQKFCDWFKKNDELILIALGLIFAGVCVCRLLALSVYDIYGYRDREAYRTVGVDESKELRGSIYAAGGEELAYSRIAYNVIISPADILDFESILECRDIIDGKNTSKSAIEQAKKDRAEIETVTRDKLSSFCTMLANLFPDEIDVNAITDDCFTMLDKYLKGNRNGSRSYYVIRHISSDEKANLESFIKSYNDQIEANYKDLYKKGVISTAEYGRLRIRSGWDYYFEQTQQRVYPQGSTAALVLGYISQYDSPTGGLETKYDKDLSGEADRRVAGRGTSGIITALFNKFFDGEDCYDLHTTIDVNVQKIVEEVIAKAHANEYAENVHAVVMETKTGKILAMANTPGYDPSDPYVANELELDTYEYETRFAKEEERKELAKAGLLQEKEDEDEKEEETYNERSTDNVIYRTNNKTLLDYFYPGSVYKTFLVAAAVEEGMNIDYDCEHLYTIPDSDMGNGQDRTMTCAEGDYHGPHLDGAAILRKSCNVCAAKLGRDMGSDMFFKWYQAFGFTEATGVDLGGGSTPPASTQYHSEYDSTSLATCSFGQNNSVTTIHIASAMSAVANGGYLMTPYIVESESDSSGNTVKKTEPIIRRQVISKQTSDTLIEWLTDVVENGGGTRAKCEHYTVAGKTGTSTRIKVINGTETNTAFDTTFAGFGPVSDPEITVVLNVLNPRDANGNHEESLAAYVAAPYAGEILERTLEYLAIPYDK